MNHELRILQRRLPPPMTPPPPIIPFPVANGDIEARGASYAPRIGITSSRIVLFTLRERSVAIEKFARCNRYVNHARTYARDEYQKTADSVKPSHCISRSIHPSLFRLIRMKLLILSHTLFSIKRKLYSYISFNAPIKSWSCRYIYFSLNDSHEAHSHSLAVK